ncbi:unnamed protein product [Polarella glacialis]|uniref:RRM domain-containing protein n=1 Tax=Polarella glacialis TaxID=89957 RepID=A0A813FG60_POLGL|nr:unnamed protein product [Polarella glacialis]
MSRFRACSIFSSLEFHGFLDSAVPRFLLFLESSISPFVNPSDSSILPPSEVVPGWTPLRLALAQSLDSAHPQHEATLQTAAEADGFSWTFQTSGSLPHVPLLQFEGLGGGNIATRSSPGESKTAGDEDDFDWTTPEPSPRLWQKCPSSPSPSTNYPSSPFPSEMSSSPYPSSSGFSTENFHVSASSQSLLLLDQAIDYGSSSPVPMQGYSAPMPMQGYSSPVPMSSPMMMPANNPVVFVQLFQQSPMSYVHEAHRVEPVPDDDATMPSAALNSSIRPVPLGFTTLVVRNIPARYNQEVLLTEFGPDGSFDLFFLPYSFKDGRTMGYAFINFVTHASALEFQQRWHRQFLQDHGRTKHLDVAAATVQGLRANLAQFNAKSIARLQRAFNSVVLGARFL